MPAEQTNKVLKHAASAISLLSNSGPQSAQELAQHLGMPRPSAYRLASALVHARLAQQAPDGTISLGPEWIRFGQSALDEVGAWFASDDILDDIRGQSGLTVYLAVPREDRAVCIRTIHGRGFQILVLQPGGSLPLHMGAVGRVQLAFGTPDLDTFLATHEFPAETPQTLTTVDALREDVMKSREQGYVLSDQDVTIGVSAFGVPVFSRDGAYVAALSVAGLREEIVDRLPSLHELLAQSAARIAQRM